MTEETTTETKSTGKFIRNVLIKGLLLFILINFVVGADPGWQQLGQALAL